MRPVILRSLLIAAWAAGLFLPFKGIKPAAVMFISILIGLSVILLIQRSKPFRACKLQPFPLLARFGNVVFPLSIIAFLALPVILKDYYLDVLIISGIYILLALGLNVIVGFAGLLNLGFAAFYAIGAYAYALLNTRLGFGFWPSLPLSAACAAFAGLLVAVPALRLKGDYLAIVTLGFGEILRLVLNNWDSLTNGPNGISGIAPPFLFGLSLESLKFYYYLVFLIVMLSIFIIRRVERSRIGRAWVAIRENEIAAASMGIDTTKYKLYAFAFGAFWAGIAGVLFASKMHFISPESFTFMESVLILSMVILGGLGNIYGAVLGAFILVLLPEVLREVQLYRMLILGIGLVLLMIFRPQGLLGGKG
ncbi:MAG: branched-chain amino acid ABC transporter permease, partial [Nitrospirae bacterium]|nr:branched-chain amino acid ABC transporter permease [Nitrospirota bacterium]